MIASLRRSTKRMGRGAPVVLVDRMLAGKAIVQRLPEEDNVEPLSRRFVQRSTSSADLRDHRRRRRQPRRHVSSGSARRRGRPATEARQLRRNFGQTAAMAAGFDHARGGVIVPMDGDLQNDPADIGACSTSSTRATTSSAAGGSDRKDGSSARLPSAIANWLIGRVTGVRLHDYGCTLKAYRAEIVERHGCTARCTASSRSGLPGGRADHRDARAAPPARRGPVKYGIGRTFKVLLDLLTVKFLSVWSTKPSYVFGGSGAILCIAGRVRRSGPPTSSSFNGVYVYRQPSLIVGVFLFTIGLNLILLGCSRADRPDLPRVAVEARVPRARARNFEDRRAARVAVAAAAMCGICGIVGRRPGRPRRSRAHDRALRHRGPDDEGFYVPSTTTAERRARVPPALDHRPRDGNQPIANEDGLGPGRVQRRDLQLPRAARASSRRAATGSRRTPTPR